LLKFAGRTDALAARREKSSSSLKWNFTSAQSGDLGPVCPMKIFAIGTVEWSSRDLFCGLILTIQQWSV